MPELVGLRAQIYQEVLNLTLIVPISWPGSPVGAQNRWCQLRGSAVLPTGIERTFGNEEIIVSKTDDKGRITYANTVFLRVSHYEEADVIGQPHNLIRHPDIPRTVFKLMWETIQSGEEIFAYVNNLAADGAHYWVLAHITPSRTATGASGGYHSNRRSPGRGAVRDVDALYGRLLTEERKHSLPADAMSASRLVLDRELAALGKTYDEFVWSLIENDGMFTL